MTKYEELQHEQIEHWDFANQKALAEQFAGRFATGLRNYLGWPEKDIRYSRPIARYTTLRDYYPTPEEAIALPETSFLWTLEIELSLEKPGTKIRAEKHIVRVQVRRKYDKLMVFCTAEMPWKVSLEMRDEELLPIYEKVFADLIKVYRDFNYKSPRAEATAAK